MTLATAPARERAIGTRTAFGPCLLAAAGCAALAARPALTSLTTHPTVLLASLYAALLAVGARTRVGARAPTMMARPRTSASVLALGVGTFALGRLIGGGHAAAPLTLTALALNTLAAFAEEAWFRRLCFGIAEPAGSGYAVVTSAALFALVHLAVYGAAVLPLDFAVGLLLGWQRVTTGSWTVPAWTHALANVLVLR
jgi:hypothetical protein